MSFLSSQAVVEEPQAGGVKPLRVLHLSPGKMYGGLETVLVTLARYRNSCPGMEPHFGLCYAGRLSRELTEAGVSVHILGDVRMGRPWTVWRARRRLADLVQRERYDAVVCHMPWTMAVFGSAARPALLVFWAHGYHDGNNWLERRARRVRPDVAISNSRGVGASISTIYPNANTELLYYPVSQDQSPESSRWRTEVRREQSVGDDTVVIIQVSRMEAWKGHLLHLEALARVKEGKWVCWMVGGAQSAPEEGYERQVRQTVSRLGLQDKVRFLGQRSDVSRLLAGADVFCQPNQGPEPFGVVFVEALRAGLPVVSTAMGGPLEIVDESCGLLAEPGNTEALGNRLERLIRSADLRARLGQAGPARARRLCDPATQLGKLHQVIQHAVATEHGQRSHSA